ncbi:Smr/MutS family protein [Pseudomonadota bacterium]
MKKAKDKAKKKKKGKAEDDQALWRAVTDTVEPLPGRDLPPQEIDAEPAPPKRIAVRPRTPELLTAPKPLPELTHQQQPGLDKSTAKRLRRGKARIEARLDLHGCTQDIARPELEDFIERAWLSGKREVLVITGKGTRMDGSIGVLRQMVPQWLNRVPNRERITAFTQAATKDGGEGALYIRIKRRG